jgi:anaerobic selenocysteine-containing dehydrogenase
MVNMLLGNIDAPAATARQQQRPHRGAQAHQAGRQRHDRPGHARARPPPPFSHPPDETHLGGYFRWLDQRAPEPRGALRPKKFNLDYRPDTMLLCHANPLWNLPGARDTWHRIMRSMRFIVAIDIIENETNDYADVILPGTISEVLESVHERHAIPRA